MSSDHAALQRDLGVYVLGALEPAERDRLEAHLADCEACRDELSALAVLPGLLSRTIPAADLAPQAPPMGELVGRLARQRRRTRRWNQLLGAAAALALVVALVAVAGVRLPESATGRRQFAADTAGVTATVDERAWGMAVQIEATQLPRRDGYVAIAVSSSGHRTQVASWAATDRAVSVTGACYLAPSEVERMEILAPDDEVLVVLRPGEG